MVQLVSAMMEAASAKEPPIADRAAISFLKQHMVKEPIYEAVSSRSVELFAAAIGTPTRGMMPSHAGNKDAHRSPR